MFLLFSKFLAFLLQPIGLVFVALIFIYRARSVKIRKRLTVVTFILLYLCSNDFIVNELHLMYETPPMDRRTMDSYDVGIVLTGGLMNEGKQPVSNLFMGNHADRFGQALLLYKEKKIKKIIISGGNVPHLGKAIIQEGELAARFLLAAGVKPTDIILENKSANTYMNARFTARILRKYFPQKRILLITSASHLPRALGCFAKQQIAVTPYGADYVAHDRKFLLIYLLPSRFALHDAGSLFHEWTGYMTYKIMGYL